MKKRSPLKAIRLKCLDCSTGSSNEIKLCVIPDCPLYPYRFGKNPYAKKREYTEEEKAVMRKRFLENVKKAKTVKSE